MAPAGSDNEKSGSLQAMDRSDLGPKATAIAEQTAQTGVKVTPLLAILQTVVISTKQLVLLGQLPAFLTLPLGLCPSVGARTGSCPV